MPKHENNFPASDQKLAVNPGFTEQKVDDWSHFDDNRWTKFMAKGFGL